MAARAAAAALIVLAAVAGVRADGACGPPASSVCTPGLFPFCGLFDPRNLR